MAAVEPVFVDGTVDKFEAPKAAALFEAGGPQNEDIVSLNSSLPG
jgi:hypothetical protein